MQVDQTLVDAHFEAIPSVGTLSTGSLTSSDLQDLGGETHGSTDMELLVQRGLLQVSADLFQVLDVARSQGNANAVDNLVGGRGAGFFLGWEGHCLIRITSDWSKVRSLLSLYGDSLESRLGCCDSNRVDRGGWRVLC